MESVWNVETAHQRFWRRLLNQNIDRLIRDPEKFLLKHMRYDNAMAKDYQKRYSTILAERGTSMYKLIAEACGEQWDSEDEQKCPSQLEKKCVPSNQRNQGNHDDLDRTREIGVLERQGLGDEVQGRPASGSEDLEKVGQGLEVEEEGFGGTR